MIPIRSYEVSSELLYDGKFLIIKIWDYKT